MKSLFDAKVSEANRDDGMWRVQAARERAAFVRKGQRAWLTEVLHRESREGTCDLIRFYVERPDHIHPNTFGPMLPNLAKAGVLENTGRYVKSVKTQSNATSIPVWKIVDDSVAYQWLENNPEMKENY